jgi:hypothetical protein
VTAPTWALFAANPEYVKGNVEKVKRHFTPLASKE